MDFNFTAKNIGPLREFSSRHQIKSCNIGIFANNGSGKTFLSRMFRSVSLKEFEQDQLNSLLTINENTGRFLFELKNPKEGGRIRKLDVDIIRNAPTPQITNESGYLFHVFNSDYVRENIEVREYAADGNIEGYILGKGNIDLSKEKKELQSLCERRDAVIEELKGIVISERKKLDALGVRKNLGQYKEFNFDHFRNGIVPKEPASFARLSELHNALKAMPDDLPDARPMPSLPKLPNISDIKELLGTAFSRSSLAEDFVQEVKAKQSFIEQGLHLSDEEKCPFCRQPYSASALELIKNYNDYLADKEAQVVRQCENKIRELNSIQKQVEECIGNVFQAITDFEKKKKYIPSLQSDELSSVGALDKFYAAIERVGQCLADKVHDIERVDFDIDHTQQDIETFIGRFDGVLRENKAKIDKLNTQKNNKQNEKRELDRRLCRALFLETKAAMGDKFVRVSSLSSKIELLGENIEEREAQVRVKKRKRVAGSLTRFLDLFFDGKYRFDENEFCITFQGEVLGQKISSVLSDGEKSIVAFCHYLAETHLLFTQEEDYKKIFFVIDDPISSLDFHYVYAVAQVIRNIGTYFRLEGHPRFLVLTHNIEFMSILIRNRIIQERFVLTGNRLERLNDQLIMPYEAHLRDIYEVARSAGVPKHTTPNSIRHVLETISRFEAPRAKLKDYFAQYSELQENEFIYSLMHDGSHGMFRTDKAYTEDMIGRGCEAVIKFIENKFKGQITHMVMR